MARGTSTTAIRTALLALGLAAGAREASAGVVVIGHSNLVGKLDVATLQRIFTGKVIEVGGVSVTAVNAHSGSPTRSQFLQVFLKQDEDKYTAYWTVRRYIGKGVPPRELATSADIISFVKSTPGAIGYIDESEITSGLNVLLHR
jgi:ABC-type phosphate transport system substrate-binding protein